jgi:hypothetical protein
VKIHLNIILPSKCLFSFPQVSPPKPRIHLATPPYALHVPPISFYHPNDTRWGVSVVLRKKPQFMFCVRVRPRLHSDTHICAPFWTLRILGR